MPISAAYDVLDDKERGIYDSFIVKVKDEDELESAIANIERRLEIIRHVTPDKRDFTVTSNKAQQERRAEITQSLTVFLTAIDLLELWELPQKGFQLKQIFLKQEQRYS